MVTLVPVLALSNPVRAGLEEAFAFVKTTTKHGGLLVQQRGRLIFERYFGKANGDSTPNLASVGKSFTSICMGILMHEKAELFRDGLDTLVFDRKYLPREALPPNDNRKPGIRLGQLLTMTSGFRGNTPGYVHGKRVPIEPPGPDGWQAMHDKAAIASDLWCDPGAGYSYATAGVHLVSMIVRHVSGRELRQYIDEKIAGPLNWGKWGFGYRRPEITHTPGGGGIELAGQDIVRFGETLLRGGRGIIPADYIRLCGRPSPYNPHYPYSLQFNVNADAHVTGAPRDAFWKSGSGGHCIYIVPSLELVIWKLGGRDEQYGFPPDRQRFTPPVDAEQAAHRTLEMVVDAVKAG